MLGFKPGAAGSGSSFAAPHSCYKIINGLYQALIVQINWLQFEAFAPVLIFKLSQSFYRVRIMKNSLACTSFLLVKASRHIAPQGTHLNPLALPRVMLMLCLLCQISHDYKAWGPICLL